MFPTYVSCSEGTHIQLLAAHPPEFEQKVKVIYVTDKMNGSYLN